MGLHRKPKTTRATAAAVGAATLGVATLSLFTSGDAHAATTAQWDAIAQCESGGVWNLPYGDASSTGGLQIQQPTWVDYGGLAYAPHPYQASKSQQIAVAEKILAGQGPGAWTTVTNGCAAPTATVSNLKPGGQPAPAPDPAPAPTPTPVPVPAPQHHHSHHHHGSWPGSHTGQSWSGSYTVKQGDSLWSVAQSQGVDWSHLCQHNSDVSSGDVNLIHPGEVLHIPG